LKERYMRFGDFVKKKRLADPREITLSDMSKVLGISLSFLSDIENRRRRPFNADEMQVFADYLDLSESDRALLYDLASRESGEVPQDIEEMFMYEDVGDMARFALRQTKAGNATEEDWKQLIRRIEENKRSKEDVNSE